MVGKFGQAGGRISVLALAVTCLAAIVAPFKAAGGTSDQLVPLSCVGSFDPGVFCAPLIGAVVVCSFVLAVALSAHSALRRARRSRLRRDAFISSALNNFSQGVMMTDAQDRVVFCNDRF